ncbi:hypothetical protein A4D02_04645 [Niastella koreensis]|uniref:Tetracycline regulation of excision, RteC n=2 Tax=Niastella koreensis TaxID=354356 RepID=G8TRX4_NIAKG|nr:hypothetical protein [Niastella koreensis]AEW03309.1 Tetracycline regulation of excision, RteC [Niastella koreensis GR20-10]OQP55596.1 hypothetical protein A4D02_04645 [Niastella koreensis]
MKNSALIAETRQIYNSIEQQIEKISLEAEEGKRIEQSFCLAMRTWLEMEVLVSDHRFLDQEEEIYFYKNLKPQFLGLIEYFTLLYKSVLFQPEDRMKTGLYWEHELKSCRELISIYNTNCRFYEQHLFGTDLCHLEQNNRQSLLFGLNVDRLNFTDASYSYLRGRLIAMKRYQKYIQIKLYENTVLLKDLLVFDHHSLAN